MKNFAIFLMISLLSLSTVFGFIGGVMLLNGIEESAYTLGMMFICSGVGALVLERLTGLSYLYWLLLFTVNGFLLGGVWVLLPTHNEGFKVLFLAVMYSLSASILIKKRGGFKVGN